jgi:carboxypeptidase family protein/TonB-dependent receptor-like protein
MHGVAKRRRFRSKAEPMKRFLLRSALMVLLLFVNPGALWAQSGDSTASVEGQATDPNGALIAGANVTATAVEKGYSRNATTNQDGEYTLLALLPGIYDIKIEKTGFTPQRQSSVQLTVGQTLHVDFVMQVAVITETLNITTEPPVIESERTQQANTVNGHYIRNLPINRRDYLSFTLLAPGVSDATSIVDSSDFRVVQTPSSGLSFYGSNGRGNSVTVDGAEANDLYSGVRATLSQEAVQEFQINRSNYAAEFGSASGGVINIVSKSGGNELHGSIFLYLRDHHLDAADPFATALIGNTVQRIKPPLQRQQYGGSAGFPIKKNRTFFFGAYEGLLRKESAAITVLTDPSIFQPTAEQSAIIGTLAANASPTPIACLPQVAGAQMLPPAACAVALRQALTSKQSTVQLFEQNSGVFPFTSNFQNFSFRIDHNPNNFNQLFLRYNYNNNKATNPNARALIGYSRSINFDGLDSNVVGNWIHVFQPTLINEARLQWNFAHSNFRSRDPFGPTITIGGFGAFNRDLFLPSLTTERHYEAADNLTYSRGNHLFKAGALAHIRGFNLGVEAFFSGRFNFGALQGPVVNTMVSPMISSVTALQAFDLGLPGSFQQGVGSPTVAGTIPFYAFFGQDTWKARHNLTLNFGLRYELDKRLAPVPTGKNNFAPRVGFSWTPGKSEKTVIRGGYGIFYGPIISSIEYVAQALNEINGFRQIAQILTTLDTTNPLATRGPINVYQTLRRQGVIGVPDPVRLITPADLAQFGITFSHNGPRPPLTVLFRIAPDYRNPYSQQTGVGVEHEISPGLSASVSYVFVSTSRIARARDINLLPAPIGPLGIRDWSTAAGHPCAGAAAVSCYRDPLLLQENQYESSARAFYHAMIIEVTRRLNRGFSLAGNYTLSRAIDEVTDFNSDFQANDQTSTRAERALSAFNQRHRVVIYGSYQSPFHTGRRNSLARNLIADFLLAPIFRGNSARPFSLLAGTDLNGDRHNTTDRPVGAGRNTGIGPNFWSFDLRAARRIPLGREGRNLEVSFDAFNLFNRLNYATVNNTVGADFKPPFSVHARKDLRPSDPLAYTSAFDPRRIQLGLRLSF